MPSKELINAYRDAATGFIILNQPETRNALSLEMRSEFRRHLEEMSADGQLRAIVIGGVGKAFCAGGDLKTLASETVASMLERQHNVQHLLRLMMTGDKPVIAAVEGLALGAGLSIALACDIVVASREARFGAVFGKVGLGPDLGLTWTLQRRVGIGRARLMLLSGRLVPAEQGTNWGLVDQLVESDQALSAAHDIARDIAANAPLPTKIVRRILAQPFASLDQALDFEAVLQTLLVGTDDFAEGYAAFRERRNPAFQSR